MGDAALGWLESLRRRTRDVWKTGHL